MNSSCKLSKSIVILLIMLVTCGSIPALAQTPQVTLDLQNVTVQQVLRSIEKQTKYHFSFKDADLNSKSKVSISAKK